MNNKFIKKLLIIMIVALTLNLSLVGETSAEVFPTNEDLQTSTVPVLQQYHAEPETGKYKITKESRLVLEDTVENRENTRLQEVIDLITAEWLEIDLPSENTEIEKKFLDLDLIQPQDIHIVLEDLKEYNESPETYIIDINEEGILVKGATENAVLHALRTITHLNLTQEGLYYGEIVDYPDVAERRVHVDTGRKYFTKDWLIQSIRELSYLKMNTLQLHFSENMGYRIESEVAPEIVSDNYLTKDEVREIIAEADKYGISIIPSFDTPGHTEHILKSHPEFGQIDIYGNHSKVALDVTNPEAVQFVYDLLDEIMELFEGSEHIHLGADEFMEFDRDPFQSDVMPVLNDYAKETLGSEYNWKDVLATYINDLSEYAYKEGFKPRIWNDGIYYGEVPMWSSGGDPQKVKMHDYIGIDFWSQMAWNPSIANLQTFIDKGHKNLYNVNASFFYYVLRPSKPDDGREQHSFDYLNQDIRIFDEWTPGKFQENTIVDDHPSIKGASLAIWNDVPDLVGEDVITEDIAKELRSLATKSWNTSSNQLVDIYGFRETYKKVGNAPAFAKGSQLPETEDFSSGKEQEPSIQATKQLVEQFVADGAFIDNKSGRTVLTHLTALEHYETQEDYTKIVKHLKGLENLLFHQNEKEILKPEVYIRLVNEVKELINLFESK